MHIKVNGMPRQVDTPLTVAALAQQLSLNPKQVAIERNREIVPRSAYADTVLSEGDSIEIVQFIGGG